ncbi:MAG TPA: RNA methyltransferase, partial [Chloroflexota bacterium]
LLRSAAGAGVRVVLVSRGSTDPFAPKVVRGAMGAHFRLRIAADLAWAEIVRIVGSKLDIVLAESDASTPYYERDWLKPAAIVIGSEAHGPSDDAIRAASSAVSIPLQGGVESLNAAIAGSVIMFEAKRQRERTGEKGTED